MSTDQKMSLLDTIKPKSDQLNYDDLIGGPIIVSVAGLKAGSADQPVVIEIAGVNGETYMPFKPCKTVRRVLIAAWGSKGKDWIGKRMRLVGDPTVRYGGVEVGGIRVSHVSGIAEKMKIKLTQTRGKRADFILEVLKDNADGQGCRASRHTLDPLVCHSDSGGAE
jgi:hypothetical protein